MAEDIFKWVRVSTELLAQVGEWSEPVRVMVVSDVDNMLDLVFQRVEQEAHDGT